MATFQGEGMYVGMQHYAAAVAADVLVAMVGRRRISLIKGRERASEREEG